MERVTVFLENLYLYLDDKAAGTKLDPRLRLTVYRVLKHFLVIMGVTHKLTTYWKAKVKLVVKIGAFGQDQEIETAMARLETLVSDVTSIEITVIVKDVSKAARDIRSMDKKLDEIADAQNQATEILAELRASDRARVEQE